ncbi:hypothetical protein FOZ63_019889, partial [Perkinsus olseni]
ALVPYEIRHLPGISNTRADGLSRVLEAPITGSSATIHSLLRAVIAEETTSSEKQKKGLFETAEEMHAEGERDADTDWCCNGCPGHLLPSPETHAIYEDGVRLVEECLPFVTPE